MNLPSPCPHRPPCPGCPRYGHRGISRAAAQTLNRLAADAGLPEPPLHEGTAEGFRHRARLMVRGRSRSPKVGIFQQGTHRIVDIPNCRVHHWRINEVAAALKRAIRATGVAPYVERPHRGDLRALQVVVERSSQRAQVVLVGNADSPAPLAALADALREELGAALHSLWWNGNPERTNRILGPRWERLAGESFVRESIAGAQVFFPPGAFGQSHLDLADQLVERVAAWVPADATVAEFYAGCGAIGLGLASRCRELRMNERSPDAVEGLRRGIEELPEPARDRIRILAGDASEAGEAVSGADVVIVDPPRKGIDIGLLDALCVDAPARLIYVSCDLASLERDLTLLSDRGGLVLRGLEAFALFPYSEHVETLALLER